MSIRLPLAVAALSLISGIAFAAAPATSAAVVAKPTASTAAPVKHKQHLARRAGACKTGQVAVKGKCEAKTS